MISSRKIKAKEFADYWKDKGNEKSESQKFWMSLLSDVFDVENVKSYIEFEDKVMLSNTSFIDGWIPTTRVLIEQKSASKSLNETIKQSDGSFLTPYEQAKRYNANRPLSKHARWIITCNFKEFYIYDMEHPSSEPEIIKLSDLPKEHERLKILIDTKSDHIKREEEISKKAGDLVGILYDALYKEYKDMSNEKSQKSLNMLCVRLVFCLYAEDAGLFAEKNQFIDYFKKVEPHNFRDTLINFFKVLNTKVNDRDKYINPELAKFPYVNGGLFADTDIEIPQFTEEIINVLVDNCGTDFDWSSISPTIFGAIFEATLNPDTRRSGGMHYTSIENIHKVIDPLFLDELTNEYNEIAAIKVVSNRNKKIDEYLDKMSKLTFLDPACGSGNFLTETYRSLRKLENKCIKLKIESEKGAVEGQTKIGASNPIRVNINQFYGIEINDFAVTVAKTALWIAESQMLIETEELLKHDIDFLPLKPYDNIIEGNALRLDWDKCFNISKKFDYIMGNPPFVGWGLQTSLQRKEMEDIFIYKNGKKYENAKKLDYVSSWYVKALRYVQTTKIKCAFVSTNSITQGEQVSPLWKFLINEYNIKINFAYKSFVWNSESNDIAKVHCVIIGFSVVDNLEKIIYDNENHEKVKNINPYLMDSPNVFIDSINTSLCNMPLMRKGNQPTDGGNLILTEQEYDDFKKKEPQALPYIKKLIGGQEFIKGIKRYCLWLCDIDPKILKTMPMTLERVRKVKEMRLKSSDEGTRKMANFPTTFRETMNPESYIIIPKTSSFRRIYIPIGLLNKDCIPIDTARIIIGGKLYHFGILTSNVHMSWMRIVCGRLKSDYSYSNTLVYNNFPWPIDLSIGESKLTDKEKILIKNGYPTIDIKIKETIESTGKAILDARDLYKDSSLADLYDPDRMPPKLVKAHQDNDKAVCKAYGLTKEETANESKRVEKLFTLYKMLVNQ